MKNTHKVVTHGVNGSPWTVYRSRVPVGQIGKWTVERFEVPRDERALTAFQYGARAPAPGTYTRLVHGRDDTVMSDTPAELRDLLPLKWAETGYVLINGLGLGIAAELCLMKSTVETVTVIERAEEVIRLVHPTIADPRLTVIHADALTWRPPPGVMYNAVWHDLWNTICVDHLPDMHRLHRKYGRRAAWQGSWCRVEMETQR